MEYLTGVKPKETKEISELLEQAEAGAKVKVNGAVHTIRDMGTVAFVILRKREGLLQCVYEEGSADFELKDMKEAATVEVEGILEENEKAPNGIEIRMESVKILSEPEDEMMPLAISKWKLNTSLEAKLNYRSISLRNIRERAKFRIQEGLTRAFRDFLYSQEFTEIHTPKIGAKGAEGGANIFKLEYFHRPAVLAQSPQFYKQMMVGVFDRVFETAPVFRAEKHNTKRHLNEYTSLDFEMGYIDGFEDIMAMETGFLQYAMELLKKDYARELKVLGVELPDVSKIPAVKFADIKEIVAERKANGEFKNLKDFIERMSGKDINKRTIENFIKSGAFDELGGTRKQFMVIYVQILDQVNREKKNSMTGQMSLFDIVGEEQKSEFDIPLPNVGEYEKSTKLAFEKEVLGIYLSGHPMEEYEEQWRKGISKTTQDFQFDEELGFSRVRDGATEIIGGIIAGKTIKYTKNNKTMAFLLLEDLFGTVEVIVFPGEYERYHTLLNEDEKVFITGRANVEEDKNGKIICEQITSFDSVKRELWLQFSTKEEFEAKEQELYGKLHDSDGRDSVVIYISSIKAMKRLPNNYNICINQEIVNNLTNFLGENNVKVVEKSIEKRA